MAGWGGWSSNDSMTIARNAGQLSVSHTQQTGEISNVGYNFEGGVVAGEQHRLRFKLSSIENGSPVTVYLRQQTTPRQPLTEKVLLTANVAQQSFDLTFDVLQSHAGGTRLLFVIDDRTEAVSIDDVSLVKVSAEQPSTMVLSRGTSVLLIIRCRCSVRVVAYECFTTTIPPVPCLSFITILAV